MCRSSHPDGLPSIGAKAATTSSLCALERSALAEELLEALGQVRGVEAGQRLGVLALGAVGTRSPERVRRRRGAAGGGLLRSGTLLGSALGGVAALALLALRSLLAALAGAGEAGHAREAATAATGHRLHHLLGLAEALEQLVDLGDGDARALGDAGAARAVDLLGVGALERGHRAHHRLDAVELAAVEGVELIAHHLHA